MPNKYRKRIAKLRNDLAKINRGELKGSARKTQREIDRLIAEAPYKVDGKILTEGMKKEGMQTHIFLKPYTMNTSTNITFPILVTS